MTEREIAQLFRKHKDSPELGGGLDASRSNAIWNDFCDRADWGEVARESKRYTLREYADWYWYRFNHLVIRPAAVSLAVFVVVFGGWTTSVSASYSVPGDVLYPVKLATENVRLRFASSPETRAKLRVQYATRRLQEVEELKDSTNVKKAELVKAAVQNFNYQLASVNEDLAQVKEENPDAAVALAVIVDQKVEEYETALATSDDSEEVTEAIVATDAAGDTAIDTLVTSVEEGSEAPKLTVEQRFQKDYQQLRDRIALALGRLSVVETVSEERGDLDLTTAIGEARSAVIGQEKAVRESADIMAAGGYRKAFVLLGEVETAVNESSAIIIELELALTTPLESEEGESAE